ncbi:MAG: hypothetical protein ACRERD_15525 [Candidatus Binatia bacterium]
MQRASMLRKVVLAGAFSLAIASPTLADSFVNGYVRRDDTYVAPYYRSNPDRNFSNNWSTYGNVNPYTGQWGTKQYPDYSSPSYRGDSFSGSSGWSSRGYRRRW